MLSGMEGEVCAGTGGRRESFCGSLWATHLCVCAAWSRPAEQSAEGRRMCQKQNGMRLDSRGECLGQVAASRPPRLSGETCALLPTYGAASWRRTRCSTRGEPTQPHVAPETPVRRSPHRAFCGPNPHPAAARPLAEYRIQLCLINDGARQCRANHTSTIPPQRK